MKHTIGMFAAVVCAAFATGCDNDSAGGGSDSADSTSKVQMQSRSDSASYMFGYQLGGQFSRSKIQVNEDVLMAGYRDGAADKTAQISDSAAMMLSEALQKELMKTMEAEAAKDAATARKESDKFMSENKTKEGVITTPSGLQYKVIKMGTGKKPKAGSTVTVHYTGKLYNGKVFDSSVERGQPATFNTTQVIPGWQEAVLLMPQGSKFQLYIPPQLAYGDRGAGNGVIPGGAALIFDVELLKVQ